MHSREDWECTVWLFRWMLLQILRLVLTNHVLFSCSCYFGIKLTFMNFYFRYQPDALLGATTKPRQTLGILQSSADRGLTRPEEVRNEQS